MDYFAGNFKAGKGVEMTGTWRKMTGTWRNILTDPILVVESFIVGGITKKKSGEWSWSSVVMCSDTGMASGGTERTKKDAMNAVESSIGGLGCALYIASGFEDLENEDD